MSRRFFVDSELREGIQVSMNGPEYNDERKHMHKVMRKSVGDIITLTNGRGLEAEAEILSLDKQSASFRVGKMRQLEAPFPALTVLQGILKGPRMDWLVEKLTELGVSELIPVLSQNVASADGLEDVVKRRERWQRLSLGAVKQSGAAQLLEISDARELKDLQKQDDALAVFCSFSPEAVSMGKAMEICKSNGKKNLLIAVGPESGFSQEEESLLENKGFVAVSLGANVLRGETAALVACALARDWIDFLRRNDINK